MIPPAPGLAPTPAPLPRRRPSANWPPPLVPPSRRISSQTGLAALRFARFPVSAPVSAPTAQIGITS